MEWFDFTWGTDREPGGILELSETVTARGLALELHVFARGEGTLAVWVLEDGTVIWEVKSGTA